MLVLFECTYCGQKREVNIYSSHTIRNEKCHVCGDRHLKATSIEENKIDYYAEGPQQEDDREKEEQDPDMDYDSYL